MKYVAILRGINVSGKNLIKMDALRKMVENLDFKAVKTYIQSGNVLFEGKVGNTDVIAKRLQSALLSTFELEVPVLVLTKIEFETVVENNPFLNDLEKDEKFFHVTILGNEIDSKLFQQVEEKHAENEVIKFFNKSVYLYLPNGYGNKKVTNTFIEKKLKNTATTRNWKTCLELKKLLEI